MEFEGTNIRIENLKYKSSKHLDDAITHLFIDEADSEENVMNFLEVNHHALKKTITWIVTNGWREKSDLLQKFDTVELNLALRSTQKISDYVKRDSTNALSRKLKTLHHMPLGKIN